MLERILVGLDGSPLAETILPYVGTLAKGLGAEVTLLQVIHLPEEILEGPHPSTSEAIIPGDTSAIAPPPFHERHPTLGQVVERAETAAQDYLYRVAQRLQSTGVTVHTAVRIGDAAREVVQTAQREGMELIALATHGRSGVQRLMYGSVAEKVLHSTRTPLLLIRPSDGAVPTLELSRVMVPLDGSLLAEAALPYAEHLATGFGVPLVLLRAVEPVHLPADPEQIAPDYAATLDVLRTGAAAYLDGRAEDVRSKGLTVSAQVVVGGAAAAIVEYGREHPGTLVVMATHGRTGLAELVLGSVARRVVQQAGAPILLVRPAIARAR